MFEKYLSPSKYAKDILSAHKNDYAAVKKIFLNDRGALGVISALLLATNLSSLTASSDPANFSSNLSTLHLALHLISAMFAFACIWIGSQQYLKINMLPGEGAYEYKLSMSWYEEPINLLTASLATLPWATVFEVYLTHGPEIGNISLWIVSIIFSFTVILVVLSAIKYHSALRKCEQTCSVDQGQGGLGQDSD